MSGMSPGKEEIAADLVWRYVEHLRTAAAEGRSAALSRAELRQLAEVLDTASRLPEALQGEESEQCHAAVRDRLHAVLGDPAAQPAQEPAGKPAPPPVRHSPDGAGPGTSAAPRQGMLVPIGALRLAGAALLALSAALATVNFWHQSPPQVVVRRVPVPRELPDVRPLDETQSHRLIRSLVRNRISRDDERNLMWHMLVCPGCFEEYVREREGHAPRQTASAEYR